MKTTEEQTNELTPRHKEIFDQVQKINLNDDELIFTAFQSKDEETGKYEVTGFGEISDKMTLEMFKQAYEESDHFRDAIHQYIGERALEFAEKTIIPMGKKLFGMASDIISGIMEDLGNDEEEEEEKLTAEMQGFMVAFTNLYKRPSTLQMQKQAENNVFAIDTEEVMQSIQDKYPELFVNEKLIEESLQKYGWPIGVNLETQKGKIMVIVR